MKSFTVSDDESGIRLDKYVLKKTPLMPRSMLYKHFRNGRVKVDGRRCRDFSVPVAAGQVIELYISDDFFAEKPANYDFLKSSDKLTVVYEDENILLADKPPGLICHPAKGEYGDTLVARIQRYLYEKGEFDPRDPAKSFAPTLANRIDRGTGGIVIAAKNSQSLRCLCRRIRDHELNKHYLAVLQGIPKQPRGRLVSNLSKNEKRNTVKISRSADDYRGELEYEIIGTSDGKSLADILLLTGFSHQIRVQFASIGCPLVGDLKYGGESSRSGGFSRQALYAYRLDFCARDGEDFLSYLDGRSFTVRDVPFVREAFGVSFASICGQDS